MRTLHKIFSEFMFYSKVTFYDILLIHPDGSLLE